MRSGVRGQGWSSNRNTEEENHFKSHLLINNQSVITNHLTLTHMKKLVAIVTPVSIREWRSLFGSGPAYTVNGGSLFGGGGSGSVQPVNQQPVGGGASRENRRHLWLVPALNGSVCRPLQVTDRKRKRRRVTWEGGAHLSDDVAGVLCPTWRPGELWPSAQAPPWKRISWLRTCCYTWCKLQQTPEEETQLRLMGDVVLTPIFIKSLFKIQRLTILTKGRGFFLPGSQ